MPLDKALQEKPARATEAVCRYARGREDLARLLMVALLSGGHVLIEGLPGTAKTLVARLFAQAIGGEFRRVQLTPDLLPGDITGFYFYRPDGSSRFVPGPLFANVVLADELNRATPRTQSAFLEAMQEGQVTVEGITHPLPRPFLLVATQVPYGGEGTFPLTDVQADRFQFRLFSGYPDRETERQVLDSADALEDPHLDPVLTPEEVLRLREAVREVFVSEAVRDYILDLVSALREDPELGTRPSPRASLALYRGARALAFLEGRDFVLPDDVRRLALPALVHRVRPLPELEMEGATPEEAVRRALERVPVPKGGE